MAIVDDLKARMKEVLRSKDEIAKNISRLAYSEMQLASARSGKDVSDDEAIAILKKLVKSNEDTLAVATDAQEQEALAREIELLAAMLPKTLGLPEIVAAVLARNPVHERSGYESDHERSCSVLRRCRRRPAPRTVCACGGERAAAPAAQRGGAKAGRPSPVGTVAALHDGPGRADRTNLVAATLATWRPASVRQRESHSPNGGNQSALGR
jgi:uncharacterized protein YqeY